MCVCPCVIACDQWIAFESGRCCNNISLFSIAKTKYICFCIFRLLWRPILILLFWLTFLLRFKPKIQKLFVKTQLFFFVAKSSQIVAILFCCLLLFYALQTLSLLLCSVWFSNWCHGLFTDNFSLFWCFVFIFYLYKILNY